MLKVQPSPQLISSNTHDSSDLEALTTEARELKRLTQDRRPSRFGDDLADMMGGFLKPQEVVDPFRQCRQGFLLKIGKLVQTFTNGKLLNYPRNFLNELLAGLQPLKNLGLSEEAYVQITKFYQPWSEELIHGCEVGLNFSRTYSSVAETMMQADPGTRLKVEKMIVLLNAYNRLQDFLAEQPPVLNPSLEAVLLEFDRAWWEYLYIFYHPIPREQLKAEAAPLVQQKVENMLTFIEASEHAPNLQDEMDDVVATFTELFDVCVSKMVPKEIPEPAGFFSLGRPEASSPVSEETVLKLLATLEKPMDYSSYRGRLKEFIMDHFDIAFQSPCVQDLSEVTEFYITDIHNSFGHRELYTAFVHLFATAKSVVAIEAARGPCRAKKGFHSLWMRTDARIVGWDMKTEEIIPTLDKSLHEYNMAYLILMGAILDPHYRRDKKRSVTALLRILKDPQNAARFKKLIETKDQIHLAIPETFQARNRQMIQTTREEAPAADIYILIGGEAHLVKQEKKKPEDAAAAKNAEYFEDPRFDLTETHDFLKTRKAVVLLPKQAKVEEASAPYNSFLFQASFGMLFGAPFVDQP